MNQMADAMVDVEWLSKAANEWFDRRDADKAVGVDRLEGFESLDARDLKRDRSANAVGLGHDAPIAILRNLSIHERVHGIQLVNSIAQDEVVKGGVRGDLDPLTIRSEHATLACAIGIAELMIERNAVFVGPQRYANAYTQVCGFDNSPHDPFEQGHSHQCANRQLSPQAIATLQGLVGPDHDENKDNDPEFAKTSRRDRTNLMTTTWKAKRVVHAEEADNGASQVERVTEIQAVHFLVRPSRPTVAWLIKDIPSEVGALIIVADGFDNSAKNPIETAGDAYALLNPERGDLAHLKIQTFRTMDVRTELWKNASLPPMVPIMPREADEIVRKHRLNPNEPGLRVHGTNDARIRRMGLRPGDATIVGVGASQELRFVGTVPCAQRATHNEADFTIENLRAMRF